MKMALALMGALVVASACAQRAPTLPPLTQEEMASTERTEDWKDWGPEEAKKRAEAAIDGTRQTDAQIDKAFRGRVLRGCYPNGEAFAETLAQDGRFFDAMNNGVQLGTWRVENQSLCFRYPERAQAGQPDSCFAVFKASNRYDFYTADLAGKVASTVCPQ